MSTETEGLNLELSDDSTQSLSNNSFTVEKDGEKKTVTVQETGGFHIEYEKTDAYIEDLVAEVKPDVPYESPPEPTEIKVFGGTVSVAANADPKEIQAAVKDAYTALSTTSNPVDNTESWFTPEEFAKRVEANRQWIHGLRSLDHINSVEVIRRVKHAVNESLKGTPKPPTEVFRSDAKKSVEAMSNLMQRLNEIHFTEEEALIAGNLLSGHLAWKIWYENGAWQVVENKAESPKTFVTAFRHAAAAMKMNTLLNMGRSSVDPDVLAVIGACKRLDDIIDTLSPTQKTEYEALMNFINTMPDK